MGELEVDSDVLKWSAESEKKRAKYPFAQKEWKQMENAVKSRLQSVQLGKPQAYKNIAIVPLIAPADGTFQYRTLGEALSAGDLVITEISANGSVPELLVVNRGNKPVLLIDGEELAGAKQNRVLNTSILLKEASETKIPVSCTEQGRWSYASKAFSESGNVMNYRTRSMKTQSVHYSLETTGTYHSDQSEVWDGIAELQAKACAKSPTSAMNDVFKAREDDLRECDEIFISVPNQVGLFVFIGGAPAGVDMISLTGAYTKIHQKLVRSYALEGLLECKQHITAPNGIATHARQFLDEITVAEERHFPSIGYGTDHRLKGKDLAGAALVHENEAIHAAFFRVAGIERPERMASYRDRRRHSHE